MNNKGQSLVLFVLVLPLITLVIALCIDVSYVYHQNVKTEGIIENNLEVILKKDITNIEKINDVISKNIPNSTYDINIIDEKIYLKVNLKEKRIFNHIWSNNTDSKIYYYCGDYNTNIIYEKEECL